VSFVEFRVRAVRRREDDRAIVFPEPGGILTHVLKEHRSGWYLNRKLNTNRIRFNSKREFSDYTIFRILFYVKRYFMFLTITHEIQMIENSFKRNLIPQIKLLNFWNTPMSIAIESSYIKTKCLTKHIWTRYSKVTLP